MANDNGLGTTTAAYTLDGDAAKAHATVNLDRLGGLADGDVITLGANANGTAQTVTYTVVAADHSTGTANSDVLGANLAAVSTTAVDFSIEYNSETNTLIMRNDTAGNSFTGTPTIAIDNAWNYNGGSWWWCKRFHSSKQWSSPYYCKCNNR